MLQDLDVETLMQEITQWGPQDKAGGLADGAGSNDLKSQTPPRVSPDKAEQPAASLSHSLTPKHSTLPDESPMSSAKVSKASALRIQLRVQQQQNCLQSICPGHTAS